MSEYLTHIKIRGHKVLPDFEWSNIPRFVVITGINGSGKTQFLQTIATKIQNPDQNAKIEIKNLIPADKFSYIPWQYSLNGMQNDSYQGLHGDIGGFIEDAQRGQLGPDQKRKFIHERIKQEIKTEVIAQPSSFYEDARFRDLYSKYWAAYEEVINHAHISKLFVSYIFRETQAILESRNAQTGQTDSTDNIRIKIGRPPWEIINEQFRKYGFPYRINHPEKLHNTYRPVFFTENNPDIKIGLPRYCHENYLTDPLLFFALMVDIGQHEFKKIGEALGYNKGEEYLFKTGAVQKSQEICDAVLKQISGLKSEMNAEEIHVSYVNGLTVKMPKYFETEKGKNLLAVYKKAYSVHAPAIHIRALRELMFTTMLIPLDLHNVFEKLVKVN